MENDFIVCPKCGTHNLVTYNFCLKCAFSLKGIVPYQTPSKQPVHHIQPQNKAKLSGFHIALISICSIIMVFIIISSIGYSNENPTSISKNDSSNINATTISVISTPSEAQQASAPEETSAELAVASQAEAERLEALSKAEVERLDALSKAEAERIVSIQSTLTLYKDGSGVGKPNSVGGVNFYMHWVNNSEKVIKYITFTVTPYNAVKDVVYCEITGKSLSNAKNTGPYKKGEGESGDDRYWECLWYNSTITACSIAKVGIEYMDGTFFTIESSDMQYVWQ